MASIRITVPSPLTTPGLPTPLQLSINTTNAATELINNSYLTYLVPSETNINLEKALEGFDGSKQIHELIEQRDALFFGKKGPGLTNLTAHDAYIKVTNMEEYLIFR